MLWLVYAISAAIIWGLDYSLSERILSAKISPFTLLAMQMAFGTIVFGIIGYFTDLKTDLASLAVDKATFIAVIAAIITFNLGNLLIFLSVGAKNATIAGIVELSYPLFTIFFTWFLFKETHINLNIILGGFLIAAGIIIISIFSQ